MMPQVKQKTRTEVIEDVILIVRKMRLRNSNDEKVLIKANEMSSMTIRADPKEIVLMPN
jgi:hypothetical protein